MSSMPPQRRMLPAVANAVANEAPTSYPIAQVARETQRVVALAGEATDKGIESVTLVMAHMESIREASREVTEIVGAMDAIALQSNLLAINAGIEAARAGEHGRGFGVLATEMRSLAQKSAEAAKRIKQLAQESTRQVGKGVEEVDALAEAIAAINGRVAEVNELMERIVASDAANDRALPAP